MLPLRLRNVLLRILNRGLIKYRPSYIPSSSWDRLVQHGVASSPNGAPQPTTPDGQTSQMKGLMSPFSRGPAAGGPEAATALSNAGNLYGLQACLLCALTPKPVVPMSCKTPGGCFPMQMFLLCRLWQRRFSSAFPFSTMYSIAFVCVFFCVC